MITSGQPPAVPKKRNVIAALAFGLVFFLAWFLFALYLAAFSSILQPEPGAVTVGGVFIASGALAWLFLRLARSVDSLKTLKWTSLAANVFSLVFFLAWFALAMLALSLFPQPERDAVTVGGALVVSGVLARLFLRLARSVESLKTLKLTFRDVLAFSLVFFLAWFLSAAGLLALSTFLPPWPSAVTLGGVFIVSGALARLFFRLAPVRESLATLLDGPGPQKMRAFRRLAAAFAIPAALLALNTFLPPWPGAVTLGGVFAASCVLAWLLTRWPPVRESLEILRDGPGPHKKRAFGRLAAALGLLAAGSFLVMSGTHAFWHWRLTAFKQSLKEKGLPVTLRDLQENLPDEEYAYPRLEKAVEKDFDWEFYRNNDTQRDSYNPEMFSKQAKVIAHYTPYLEKELMPLLSGKYARYLKVDYAKKSEEPFGEISPNLGRLIRIAQIAGLCAVSRAAEGETAKAWALVRLQFTMADFGTGGKDYGSRLEAVYIRRHAAKTALNIVLNRHDLVIPSDIVTRFKSFLSEYLASDGLKYHVASHFDEYAYIDRGGEKIYVSWDGIYSDGELEWGLKKRSDLRRWFDYNIFLLLRCMGMVDKSDLDIARYLSALTAKSPWPQLVSDDKNIQNRIQNLPSWPYWALKQIAPGYLSLHREEFELKAWTQLALACSELGRYRRERGRYPGEITELASENNPAELLKDVFTGGWLMYVPSLDRKSYALCSSGPNGDKKEYLGKEICGRRP